MVYLFQIGQDSFSEFVRELWHYGVRVDPSLELRRGEGMWCHYDMNERQIYLSVPNTAAPGGKLYLLYLRSLLCCESNAEFMQLSEFLIPYFVAHEMGHHLRHRYGQFSDNPWHEEQVANQLAIALNKPRLDIEERRIVGRMVQRAVTGLAEKLNIGDEGVASYRNLWAGLHATGVLRTEEFRRLQFIHRIFPGDGEAIAVGDPQLADTLRHHLQKREVAINEINTDYADDMTRYLYYHLHWLALELENQEHEYVTTFAHDHLGLQPPLLPTIPRPEKVNAAQILACFKAHEATASHSQVLGTYFYRRYVGLLLTLLQDQPMRSNDETPHIPAGTGSMLQSDILAAPGLLQTLAHLAGPSCRELFPQNILNHPDYAQTPVNAFPTETDQRLSALVQPDEQDGGQTDTAAANTLELLERLYRVSVFDSLPAEIWLELVHRFMTIKLEEGDSLIWKDDVDHDVFILLRGELAVLISEDGRGQCVERVQPGQLIGEIAFLTRANRQATVRATEPSECLVLRDIDLRILSFKYPDILLTIGKVLAQRLAYMNATLNRVAPKSSSIEGWHETLGQTTRREYHG
jgi:hypothetical protein